MSHLTSITSQKSDSALESVNGHVESALKNHTNLSKTNAQIDQVEGLSEKENLGKIEIERGPNTRSDSSRRRDGSKEIGDSTDDLVNEVECHSFAAFAEERLGFPKKWRRVLWKACVYLITLGMLISLFVVDCNYSCTLFWKSILDVYLQSLSCHPGMMIFFCGMFITVDGFNRTGIPSALWEFVEPYTKIDRITGIPVLAAVILVLSNLNLSLLGSAANLIVCEQAQHNGYNLTFWNHLKFGVPSTIIVTAIGLLLLRASSCIHSLHHFKCYKITCHIF